MQQTLTPYHGIILLKKSQSIELVDGTIHATLCAMAIEAFLQDLRSYYQSFERLRPYATTKTLGYLFNSTEEVRNTGGGAIISGRLEMLCECEKELAVTIEDLERKPLHEKYEAVIKLLNPSWKKGSDETYKNFRILIGLRNSLVHLKSYELDLNNEGEIIIPKCIQKRLPNLKVNSGKQQNSWIEALDRNDVIKWSRTTTHNMIIRVLKLLPDTPITNNLREDYYSNLHFLETRTPTQ
ncbi:hypothetical protein [Pseudomonas soli]|uniref:hypothetical protein n=1 Tax=Pseudomonas soli TaxID=1306993 RepID=UPI0037F7DFB7